MPKRRSEVMKQILGDVDETLLHEFADSAIGRSIAETVIKNGLDQEISDMAKDAFMQFEAEMEVAGVVDETE